MNAIKTETPTYFYKLLLLLLILVGTGLVLSFSVSYSYSIIQGRDVGLEGAKSNISIFSLFIKQLLSVVAGLIGVLYLIKTKTKVIQKMTNIIAVVAGLAMIYTAFFAPEINGSRRWLSILGVSIQTGDFARIALILFLSNIFHQYHRNQLKNASEHENKQVTQRLILQFLISIIIYLGALYLQRDYSSFMISTTVIMVIILVSDIPQSWKIGSLLLCSSMFILIVMNSPNRMERIIQYFQPGGDPLGAGFQIKKSYEIIGNGGWLGSGVGSNMLDVLHLPYFNNDFVFSIIVGEYGLIGAIGVIMLFWLLCWYAYKLSTKIYIIDRYYYFMLLAGVVNLIVSVVAHIAVTIGIVPVAGLNLPFYSSGGSSMVTSLLSYGLILRAALALDYYEKQKHNACNDMAINTAHIHGKGARNNPRKKEDRTRNNIGEKYSLSNIEINPDGTINR